jgi:cyclophilin family peptidyl-prolyl cis-trans isomerase
MASGAGGYESFTIPASSPGFDLRFETTSGPITVRPDFEQMACAAVAMHELAESGFYRGHVCDQLTYAQLKCYGSEPKNRDYGFRVSSRDITVPSNDPYPREWTVLLVVHPQDGWATGLLSLICSADRTAAGVQRLAPFGQVVEGINLLNSVVDAGAGQKDLFSPSVAAKPLRITDVKVIPWPATTPATGATSTGPGGQRGVPPPPGYDRVTAAPPVG